MDSDMKHILIAGGTGFIGQSFIKRYQQQFSFTNITRDVKKAQKQLPNISSIAWSDQQSLKKAVMKADVVLNLVGENIGNKRWTEKQKQKIIDSRVKSSQTLVDLLLEVRPQVRLLNASAIGIYGLLPTLEAQQQTVFYEDTELPDVAKDFLSTVGLAWEAPLNNGLKQGLSIVKLRFGVVLAANGGMLKKLLLPFKLGLGGRVGSGLQPLSWIAMTDLLQIIKLAIDSPEYHPVINLVAPEVISQADFAKTLAGILKRPLLGPLPTIVVKALFGQMGQELLLSGQSVGSKVLENLNYEFSYPTLKQALLDELV